MPTFNQLVRKGREQVTYQVHFSRSAVWSEHPEDQDHRSPFSPEERRLHRRENCDPQEAELRTA